MDINELIPFLPLIESVFFDDEDEHIAEQTMNLMMERYLKKRRKKRVCIKNYAEEVVPMYSNKDFKSHFRLERSTFEILLCKICAHDKEVRPGRPPINTEKQLLCVLWLLANQESYRSVADRFDVAKATLHRKLLRISHILKEMAPSIICWPNVSEVKNEFEAICGFPNVIGAIDGTHINIKAPNKHPERYYNRKGDYSVILQAVCSPNLAFTDTFCSFPGSVHDARVLRNSLVYTEMYDNDTYFPNNTHLVGDSAYPLHANLMVPYKDNGHLAPRQHNYNNKLSKTRVCIERAFGQLKGRFRRLRFFDVWRVDMIPLFVLAACVLHNICIKEDDFVDGFEDTSDDDDLQDDGDVSMLAINKRDHICGLLN